MHNLGEGSSILIPNGTVHALENVGNTPLVLVQMQLEGAVERASPSDLLVESTTSSLRTEALALGEPD